VRLRAKLGWMGGRAFDGGLGKLGTGRRKMFVLRTNAHLIDDETVAKMGHPDLWLAEWTA
jgi:hypothetical protein